MILKRLRNCPLPHGHLFLGTAETTMNLDPEYQPVTFDRTVVYSPQPPPPPSVN
jgi:chemotaxis methyl-accepting protein methylase